MIKLVDTTLELLFKCVQRLKEKHEHSERTTDNLNREMEIFKKNQVENLELEDTTCKMKSSQDRLNTAGKTPWRQGTGTIQTEAESRVGKKWTEPQGAVGQIRHSVCMTGSSEKRCIDWIREIFLKTPVKYFQIGWKIEPKEMSE